MAVLPASNAAARPLDLRGCVVQWNRASLGNGHAQVRAVAADGPRALMVAFADGACGLVFPQRQAQIGGVGNFAVAMHTASVFGQAPFVGRSTTAYRGLRTFANRAGSRPNVAVDWKTGKVRRLRRARVLRSPETVIDPSTDCPRAFTRTGSVFDLSRQGVGCALARVVVDAWADGEGRPLADGEREIIGWSCRDSDDKSVDCVSGSSQIEARPAQPSVAGP